MKPKIRSLSAIAESIHSLQRGNIIEVGDLLLEAKAQCEHGQWLDWLSSEFEWWSADTAQRYMKVAELGAKYRNVRNLKLASTTLYELARESDDDLPSIVNELAKHATKTSLKPREARRVIKVGIGRRRFGDRPDATLLQMVEIDRHNGEAWYEKAIDALQVNSPETDEGASSIVNEIEREHLDAEQAGEARHSSEVENEIDDILDGPPPNLPPPTSPPEPQRLGATTSWPETDLFAAAVTDLLELRAKPIQRFNGVFSSAKLREVSAFLLSVAAVDERKAA